MKSCFEDNILLFYRSIGLYFVWRRVSTDFPLAVLKDIEFLVEFIIHR